MEKLCVEHKMLFLSLSSSKVLTYFHIKSSTHWKFKEGLKPITENLKERGLLIPCNSPCNTPILGIEKSNDKWRLGLWKIRFMNNLIIS